MAGFQFFSERFLPGLSGTGGQAVSASEFETQRAVKIGDGGNAVSQQPGRVIERVGLAGRPEWHGKKERKKNQYETGFAEQGSLRYGPHSVLRR